ncbi:hypothetical protein Afil01_08650 [Actinorhabdospora filicis]|uniref:DUF4241 domain-containing protein n=1 Tax=Actinorhabdospora filicis TaxID=1785913 RepID=A0A9W6W7L2_9ACTN|nr:hypothetical protein [Actinorhabdospora filicis]GLZ76058.1 hypothetical protein Afil01_08650 [Actinorhabdospora filicis]
MSADAIIEAYLKDTEDGLRCRRAGTLTVNSGQLYFFGPDTEDLDGYFGGTEGSLPKGDWPVYVVMEPGEDAIVRMVLVLFGKGDPVRFEWRQHGPTHLDDGGSLVAFSPEWTDWEPDVDEALDEAGGIDLEDGPAYRPVFTVDSGDTVLVVNVQSDLFYPYEVFDADGELLAVLVNFTDGDAPAH